MVDFYEVNWCMNCEETERQGDCIFRCNECEFREKNDKCTIKAFANNHKHDYPMKDFGSMGQH